MVTKFKVGAAIRVLLVENYTMVRAGLRMILEECGEFEVIGEAATCAEALSLAKHHIYDVALIDLDLGGENSSELIVPLLIIQPQAHVLMLASLREVGATRQVTTLGARGILMKEHSPQTLIKAIECVHRGELWMDRSLVATLITDLQNGDKIGIETDPHALQIATLSPREHEVIALIGEGLKNKEIARRLFVSETTVRHHLTSIFAKLGVSDRLELVIYGFRHRLIVLEPEEG